MVKPLVGIDLDGILASFNEEFLRLSRKLLGKPQKGFVVTNFEYSKCGWTTKEVDRIFSHIRHTEDFWKTLEKRPKTSELTKQAKRLEYFFITNRMSTDGLPVAYQTEDWLRQKYGLLDPYVIVTKKKGEVAKDLDLDYFLDDRFENCLEVKKALPNCEVSVLTATYNTQYSDPKIHRVEEVNSWLRNIK